MIGNVIDRRKRPYRWAQVTVILEPVWHDNSCQDSDQALKYDGEGLGYEEYPDIPLIDAMVEAHNIPYPVTVYIYDLGEGIKEVRG